MRSVLRLAMLCLSVALLSGAILHDLAGAKMTYGMANAMSVVDSQQDDICPACTTEDPEMVVCDMDCTAPVMLSARSPQTALIAMRTALPGRPGDLKLAGRDPGADPFPPRSSFLI